MLRTILIYPVVAFFGLILGALVEKVGWADGRAAYALGLGILAVFTFPLFDRFARFLCSQCNAEHRYHEVVSRGWIFRRDQGAER
jgi:hypothetical protein